MNKKQYAAAARLERVASFGRHYKLPGARAARLLTDLDACVAAIKKLRYAQDLGGLSRSNHADDGRQRREQLRRGHMLPIRRDVLLLLRDEPGLEAAMAVPHATASNATMVAAARRMAAALKTRHRTFLVREGMPRELLAGLTTAAAALRAWEESTTAAVKASTLATRELRERLAEGGRLQTAIEGIVMGLSVSNPKIWDFWRDERRRRKKMGRPRKVAR